MSISFASVKRKGYMLHFLQNMLNGFSYYLCRIYIPELLLALYLMICASYDFILGSHKYYMYIYLQAFAYVVMGFGFVGTTTPCS
jgi:uncharacterized membrane protein AbrB (regulator of aidB expression)